AIAVARGYAYLERAAVAIDGQRHLDPGLAQRPDLAEEAREIAEFGAGHRQHHVAGAQIGLARRSAVGHPRHHDLVVDLGGVEAKPWPRWMVRPAHGQKIFEDRLEDVDRHDHVERLRRLALAHLLDLQRADAEQLARPPDHRRAAPEWMRRRREERLVEDVFPIAGEFLLGGNARHDRMLAPA